MSKQQPDRLPGSFDVRYAWVQLLSHGMPRFDSNATEDSN